MGQNQSDIRKLTPEETKRVLTELSAMKKEINEERMKNIPSEHMVMENVENGFKSLSACLCDDRFFSFRRKRCEEKYNKLFGSMTVISKNIYDMKNDTFYPLEERIDRIIHESTR